MIKLRAWDKEEKEWLSIRTIGFDDDGSLWYLQAWDENENDIDPPYLEDDLGVKWELMQSTGLKDKHGVDIFEGDVLKGPMDFGPAGFVESVAPVSYHKINGYQLHYFLLEHTEVIGNVYEDKDIKFGIIEER